MKTFKTLTFEIKERKAILTVNRPEALNALNQEVLKELDQVLSDIRQMPSAEVGVLIFTGSGEKAFIAGADIKEMLHLGPEGAQAFSILGQRVTRKFETLGIPTIAAVNGFALGGGLEMALACDFIYASSNAKLGLPEVSLGLVPGFGGTVRLSAVVGIARAKELILTGQPIPADEALRIGLVNRVFESAQLMTEVLKVADLILSRAPLALAKAKKLAHETRHLDTDSGLALEAQVFAELFATADTQEGTKAFTEKRKPQYRGR